MVQTSIAIPKPLLDALDVLARQEERSRNKIITMLLREQVANYDATRNKEQKT